MFAQMLAAWEVRSSGSSVKLIRFAYHEQALAIHERQYARGPSKVFVRPVKVISRSECWEHFAAC